MSDPISTPVIIASLEYVYEISKTLFPNLKKLLVVKKIDEFLNYDPAFLTETYASEHPIDNGIPYSEIVNWLGKSFRKAKQIDARVEINLARSDFKISEGKGAWSALQSEGFVAIKNSGRISGNEPAIRLCEIRKETNKILMTVQLAKYHDQAKSNLILDWHPSKSSKYGNTTLRTLLIGQYGNKLPPFSDKRLANTIGIACLLFYKENGQWIPYLVRRTKKIGVFPGGMHCTASGVAKWPNIDQGISFSNFFLKHMYLELDEEVGLKEKDVIDLRPVALCREFSRGGKPQLFFIGVTHLSRKSLRQRRKQARKVNQELGGWEEVERDRWLKSVHVVVPPSKLMPSVKKLGLTLEAVGAFFYGMKYLNEYGADLE